MCELEINCMQFMNTWPWPRYPLSLVFCRTQLEEGGGLVAPTPNLGRSEPRSAERDAVQGSESVYRNPGGEVVTIPTRNPEKVSDDFVGPIVRKNPDSARKQMGVACAPPKQGVGGGKGRCGRLSRGARCGTLLTGTASRSG
eukprot:COSAG04_NODE_4797_length_1890_cov_1.146845_1_plen_142_part_00